MPGTHLNVLKIDASSRQESSASRQMTARLVGRLKSGNPEASIVSRDVSGGFPIVSEDWINASFTPPDHRADAQRGLLQQSDALIAELRSADVLVIGLPVYNFSVPASLKTWIDLVCRTGETFQYGETGPEGLLKGKRAIIAVASGGMPVGSPADFATGYIKQVLGFIGITDVTFVSAVGLGMDPDGPLRAAEAEIDALDLS